MKKIILLLLTACLVFTTVSCARDKNAEYRGQAVIGAVEDEEIIESIVSVCECLGYADEIVCFDDFSDVSAEYLRLSLDYLSGKYYSRYSANEKLFAQLAEHYPALPVNTMIPEEDCEALIYRCFGGYERVEHASNSEYSYLKKIKAYLAIGSETKKTEKCTTVSCEETEDTYIFTADYGTLGRYRITLVKRDKGEPYIIDVNKA